MQNRRRLIIWVLFLYTLAMSVCCMFTLLQAYPLR